MKLHKNISISIMVVVLSSCSFATSPLEQPSLSPPDIGNDTEVGEYFEVAAPNGWNSFKTTEDISLEIRNISGSQITSSPDFGARIFVLTDQGWIEVKNKITYWEDTITLEPTENYDPDKTVSIFVGPDLPDYSITTNIKIFVFGSLYEDGQESKMVSSYIDVQLNP